MSKNPLRAFIKVDLGLKRSSRFIDDSEHIYGILSLTPLREFFNVKICGGIFSGFLKRLKIEHFAI